MAISGELRMERGLIVRAGMSRHFSAIHNNLGIILSKLYFEKKYIVGVWIERKITVYRISFEISIETED